MSGSDVAFGSQREVNAPGRKDDLFRCVYGVRLRPKEKFDPTSSEVLAIDLVGEQHS